MIRWSRNIDATMDDVTNCPWLRNHGNTLAPLQKATYPLDANCERGLTQIKFRLLGDVEKKILRASYDSKRKDSVRDFVCNGGYALAEAITMCLILMHPKKLLSSNVNGKRVLRQIFPGAAERRSPHSHLQFHHLSLFRWHHAATATKAPPALQGQI